MYYIYSISVAEGEAYSVLFVTRDREADVTRGRRGERETFLLFFGMMYIKRSERVYIYGGNGAGARVCG